MSYQVRVKWGKEKYEGVELNTNEPPITFKMQLFSLTGVPPDRQKVMIAGTTLANDDWGKAASKIKPNCTLMVMGSAEVLPEAPKQKTKFIEDMTESELVSAMDIPTGLRNLGNTCYMNATLQCLKTVPELRDMLKRFNGQHGDVSHEITSSLSDLFRGMERGSSDFPLLLFLQTLHTAVPHFGEKDERTGGFRQQDAHECWSAIMTNLSNALPSSSSTIDLTESIATGGGKTFMEQYFGLSFVTSYKCIESTDEIETKEEEKSFQVSCFIGQDVKYLPTGIQKGLQGEVEKNSPSLGRDALYHKNSVISRLPAYLAVHYVRFFFGRAGQSDDTVSKKILKDVQFTMKLDMYDFCTTELQKKMIDIRKKFKDVEDKKLVIKAKQIAAGPGAAKAKPKNEVKYEPYSFDDDPGSNNSGVYELIAVLTHQGRSSSSGHYVGWVRHVSGNWIKYDDDDVSLVTEEEILKLSGGGDWHTAYILLYAPKRLEIVEED